MHVKIKGLVVALMLAILIVSATALALPSLRAENKIYLEKSILNVGETNTVSVYTRGSDTSLIISTDGDTNNYLNVNGDLKFVPKKSGTYLVVLVNSTSKIAIDQANFFVTAKAKTIYTNKKNYALSEQVQIYAPGFEAGEKIIVNSSYTNYVLLHPKNETQFVPQLVGTYVVNYLDSNQNVLAKTNFSVTDQYVKLQEENNVQKSVKYLLNFFSNIWASNSKKGISVKMRNQKGSEKEIFLKVIDEKEDVLTKPIENQRYKSEIELGGTVNKIKFKDLKYDPKFKLKFSEVTKQKASQTFKKANVAKSYAIDPTNLDFTNGSIEATASGTALYKCKEWNFDTEVCSGEWTFVKNLVPGEKYEIELNPEDPAYIETGVSSVNTKKPIYHVGETAEVVAIILDKQGYLTSKANVTLKITSPDNTSVTYSNFILGLPSLTYEHKGILSARYPYTSTEGNYIVDILAQGENVNATFSTYFEVKNYYEYEIIRSMPHTIDPWQGPYSTTINIESLNDKDIQTITEIIPKKFVLTDSGNATVTGDADSTYLTWQINSKTAKVSYVAQAPLVSPDLYAIGQSFITYENNQTFYEARPWYLAIDPVLDTQRGLFVYQSNDGTDTIPKQTNWTGTGIQSMEAIANDVAARPLWVKIRCQKKYPMCILATLEHTTNNNAAFHFQAYDTLRNRWSNFTTISSDVNYYGEGDTTSTRGFDLECEDTNGKCLVVYENDSIANNWISYRIWNGTGLEQQKNFSVTSTNAPVIWVELYPLINSNGIGIGLQQHSGTAYPIIAGYWNGTHMKNFTQLISNAITNAPANGGPRKHYGCGWEGSSRLFDCFYANNSNISRAAYNVSTGNWTFYGRIYAADSGGVVEDFVSCGSSPLNGGTTHNQIGMIFCQSNAFRDGGVWNGTAFSKTNPRDLPDRNASECGSTKGTGMRNPSGDCKIDKTGDVILFAWSNANSYYGSSGTYTISTKQWSMDYWAGGSQVGSISSSGQVEGINIIPAQQTNEMMYIQNDNGAYLLCSYWDSTAFDSSVCGNLNTNADDINARSMNIGFDWFRYTPQPIITITSPSASIVKYNYTGLSNPSSSHIVYEGNTTNLPPRNAESPLMQIESSSYNLLWSSDANDLRTTIGVNNQRAYQSFKFYISDSVTDITQLSFVHTGHATRGTSADTYNIYAYNFSSGNYTLLRTAAANPGDITTSNDINARFTDYVQNGIVWYLVEAGTASGGGTTASNIWTDYVELQVQKIPSITGIGLINATVEDDDGISRCRFMFTNGTFTSAYTYMNNFTGRIFYNLTNTTLLGLNNTRYNLTVICNDTLNPTNVKNATLEIRINNEIPLVGLLLPNNTANFTYSNINFTWNASSSVGGTFLCNVTIDGVRRITNIALDSGKNITRNYTVVDGTHYWNVTCVNSAGTFVTSVTRRFDTDTLPPTITLNYPVHTANISTTQFNINYTPSDSHSIVNCSLFINDTRVQTNFTIQNGSINFFSVTLGVGIYNWSINCTDSFNRMGNSSRRNFTLDPIPPIVILNTQDEATFSNGTAMINYTVIDNMDKNNTCNITVNGVVTNSNVPSRNNSIILLNISLSDGFKWWNVTCWDFAGNQNISATKNFTLSGAPVIELKSPTNTTSVGGINTNFSYTAIDGDGVFNCSLIVNQKLNKTINGGSMSAGINSFFSNFSTEGFYNWSINCSDNSGAMGASQTWWIYVDKTPPQINLTYPPNSTLITTSASFNLNFTVFDAATKNMTCNVTLDGTIQSLNLLVYNSTPNLVPITKPNGNHYWNVSCFDFAGNFNISDTWNFSILVIPQINTTVKTNKKTYIEGELVYINTTTLNSTGYALWSNVSTDIVFTNSTNTSIPWWNASWSRRKQVYFSNPTTNLITGLAWLNVTGLNGFITSCDKEIRVIALDSEGDSAPINRTIKSFDTDSCLILFYANISGSAKNQSNYLVYFNNSDAISSYNFSASLDTIYDTRMGNLTISVFELNATDPPTTVYNRAALGLRNFSQINSSDNLRYQTNAPGTGRYAVIELSQKINETLDQISNLNFFFEGQVPSAGIIKMYVWDNQASAWNLVTQKNYATANVDDTLSWDISLANLISNSINSTNHVRWALVYMQANTRFSTDYVKLTVTNIPRINATYFSGITQQLINKTTNETGTIGRFNQYFNTTGYYFGNYSTISGARAPNYRFGSGYDFFEIIQDIFGPTVNLTSPQSGFTNRTINLTFIYNATDFPSGLNNCSLIINGKINQTRISPQNGIVYNFTYNDSAEGKYNWTINCTDTKGNTGAAAQRNFTIDNTPPYINSTWPDGQTLGVNDVRFNLTAHDNLDSRLSCNLSVDNGAYIKNFNAINGNSTNVTVAGIGNGIHSWNVTCYDDAFNQNTSPTRTFTIVALPIVVLDSPYDGFGSQSSNVIFYYNLSNNMLNNCSLILNEKINATAIAANIPYKDFDGINNFTITGLTQAKYNWTINCTDTNDLTGTAAQRVIYVDNSVPGITLNLPANNSELNTKIVTFNFTAFDFIDETLDCNITINGVINKTNINATSNISKIVLIGNFSSGNYTWNVTCVDNSGLFNTSETRFFNISSRVTVALTSPANNSADRTGNMVFKYIPQSVAGFYLAGFCDFYIDETLLDTRYQIYSSQEQNFSRTGVSEGNHNWTINCTDDYGIAGKSDYWFFIVDFIDPIVTTYYPNGLTFNVASVNFNWSVTDNVAKSLLCNLTVNNSKVGLNIVTQNLSVMNRTVNNLPDGTFGWNVTCVDTSGRFNTSSTKTVTIQAPPTVALNSPANPTRTRNNNATFTFTPTDNSGSILSCSLIFNGEINTTITPISNGGLNTINLTLLQDNTYNWSINCTDPNGNIGNSSTYNLTIDLSPPWINLTQPTEGQVFNTDDIRFNWTAFDKWGIATNGITCNVTIDLLLNKTGVVGTSGLPMTYLLENMSIGRHNYTITCWDSLGWTNSSDLTTFIVNAPDLTLNSTDINFNNTKADVNESIRINATIYNIGGYPGFNILIEFWDGDPATGLFIGNTTLSVLDPGKNATANITWNITEGKHEIFVLIDPYQTMVELDISNNNASRNVSPLLTKIIAPSNATWTQNLTQDFNLTAASYLQDTLNYILFIDGVNSGQTGSINDNTSIIAPVTLTEGLRKIKLEVNDSQNRRKNSTELWLYVDLTSPTISFQTNNNTWFNTSTPLIRFTINDNLDLFLNYTLYLNNIANISNVSSRNVAWNNTLNYLVDGTYYINISSYDDANNFNISNLLTIFVDTTPPYITINYPISNFNFTGIPELNYTAYDNLATLLSCNITLNGIVNRSRINSQTGVIVNTNISGLAEGQYFWNVTCTDNATNKNTSETRIFNYFRSPILNLTFPQNGTWTNQENVTFFFNVSDETGLLNCSVVLNENINETIWNQNITNFAVNNITAQKLNGTYLWAIVCFDNTTFTMRSQTNNRTLFVDLEAPTPILLTNDSTWFASSTPVIAFNMTDNMDVLLNYTIYVDGIANKNGTISNGTSSSPNLYTIENGPHLIVVEGGDKAGNKKNSSAITIYVDTVPSIIELFEPPNGNITFNETVMFNFSVIDATSLNMTCNLTVDNVVLQRFNITNSTSVSTTFNNLSTGLHFWNVTCLDQALNKNISETRNFTIPLPDLIVNATDIIFNETSPKEGSNITINATIYNIGLTAARNVTVQVWNGNWTTGINLANFTLNISANSNATIGLIWRARLGQHNIYVLVDPPIATNGSIRELNETNNYAFNTIGIIFWHFFFGNVSGTLVIGTQNNTVFDWAMDNYNGSNIFAANSNNNINWLAVKAIGINRTNETSFLDFATLDIALNSTAFPDSINKTFTTNNVPARLESFVVFGYNITNVSVSNSTNTSNYLTGILWDSSQGPKYNGTQDIAFVTESHTGQGSYGLYDYELRVPATLRTYKGATNSVSFYTEIK